MTQADLEGRIARLEAVEAIRQIASRYAAALDRRDPAAMAQLFLPDVQLGNGRHGREALTRFFEAVLQPYTLTFHLIGNHIIDFEDDDRASGIVYCRPEHQVDDLWIVMPMQYWDRYERRDGDWFFKSRSPHVFYAADVLERPQQAPDRFRFPDNPMLTRADLPERWPSWGEYWDRQRARSH